MWNPESTDMESGIHSVESGIQDSLGLGRFVLNTQTANPFGYTRTVVEIHSTIVAVIMNTTMEN